MKDEVKSSPERRVVERIRGVRFSDISVNGRRVTALSELTTEIQNAEDISFE